jgi:hypothetical protein|tara:strand:+ start:373 stop:711 length:339 start_codon:yes stop_codon:yes gene_type:complete
MTDINDDDEDVCVEFTKYTIEFRPWSVDGMVHAEVVAETIDDAKKKFLSMLAGACIPSYYNLTGSGKLKVIKEQVYEEDRHVVCYSYPNCDEAPAGCVVRNGEDAEAYGHRD